MFFCELDGLKKLQIDWVVLVVVVAEFSCYAYLSPCDRKNKNRSSDSKDGERIGKKNGCNWRVREVSRMIGNERYCFERYALKSFSPLKIFILNNNVWLFPVQRLNLVAKNYKLPLLLSEAPIWFHLFYLFSFVSILIATKRTDTQTVGQKEEKLFQWEIMESICLFFCWKSFSFAKRWLSAFSYNLDFRF